uniref:Major intrinsic protein n=1 Tax=viral metagenome TaxID=1070528 RepID=A0A6C0AIH2_9ZZZZ
MYVHAMSEYLGTCLLIGAIAFTTNPLFVVAAFAVGIALAHRVSGAHFNPAVTLWAYLSGKVGLNRALAHTVAQLAAAATVWILHYMIKV